MDTLQLLIALHEGGRRQGPGGDAETRLALDLSGLRGRSGLRIADVGCGTGAAALVLARELDAEIEAVDFLPVFLSRLDEAAAQAGLAGRIRTHEAGMEALPFEDASLDAIFSEGAIYNMGFAAGVARWRRFLKPGGILAVSELTWLTAQRPADLQAHWEAQYAEVATASAKMALLEASGYAPLGYFVLPPHCWLANYYEPLQGRFEAFLDAHARSEAAAEIVAAEEREIALYRRFADFFGYGYYVARRVD